MERIEQHQIKQYAVMFFTFNLFIFKMSIRKRQSSIHEYIIIYKHLSNINQSLNLRTFVQELLIALFVCLRTQCFGGYILVAYIE